MKKTHFNPLHVPETWRHYWSKYPEGYTILESLMTWVSQVDDMVKHINELDGRVVDFKKIIDDFLKLFDSNLHEKVVEILTDWQETGFLEVVINEALDTKYHEMDERLTSYVLENHQRVEDIYINIDYPPAGFEPVTFEGGTNNLQSLIDYCVARGFNLIFPHGKNDYYFNELNIPGKIKINFNNSRLFYRGENTFITVNTDYRNTPQLVNFRTIGTDERKGNFIDVARMGSAWGGSVVLENFEISYYNKALSLYGNYRTVLKSGRVAYSNTGLQVRGKRPTDNTERSQFTNELRIDDTSFTNNLVTIDVTHIRQFILSNCSFELTDVAIKARVDNGDDGNVFNTVKGLMFDNCWFENVGELTNLYSTNPDNRKAANTEVDKNEIVFNNCYFYKIDKHNKGYFSHSRQRFYRSFENEVVKEVTKPQVFYIEFDSYMYPSDIVVKLTNKYGGVDPMVKKMSATIFGRTVQSVDSEYTQASEYMKDRFRIGDIEYNQTRSVFRLPIYTLSTSNTPRFVVKLEIQTQDTDNLPYTHPQSTYGLLDKAKLTEPLDTEKEFNRVFTNSDRLETKGLSITKQNGSTTTDKIKTGFTPRMVVIQAYTSGTTKKSFGTWEYNGFERCVCTMDNGGANGRDSIVLIAEDNDNQLYAHIKNVSSSGFDLVWNKKGITNTNIILFITVTG